MHFLPLCILETGKKYWLSVLSTAFYETQAKLISKSITEKCFPPEIHLSIWGHCLELGRKDEEGEILNLPLQFVSCYSEQFTSLSLLFLICEMGTPCFLDVKTHFLILAVFLPFGSWPLLSQCTKHSFNLFFTQDCFCGKRLLGLPLAGWEQGGRRLEQWLLPTSCSLFGDTRVCCLRVPRHSETVGPSVDGGYTSRHLGIYRAPWCCIHTHVRGMRLHLFSEILICFLTWRITLSSKLIFLDDKEDPSVASSRSSPAPSYCGMCVNHSFWGPGLRSHSRDPFL